MNIKGKKLFVKALQSEGVDTIFAYPGATITDLLDEVYMQDGIRVVLPRHEQALIHAAEGYARATGKAAVCLVTSGPGATNTVTAIADAFYDSIPLVVFTGQVALNLIGNDAFQEVDIVGITRSITKYGVTIRKREDVGPTIKKAFHIAQSGRPGPVLIDFPKDIQNAVGPAEYPEEVNIRGYKINGDVHLGQLKKAVKMLKVARRPIILAGGGINIAKANDLLRELTEVTNIPVITTIMGKGALPADHPNYIGNCGLHGRYAANMAINDCDVLFSIGTRFNDRITGDLNEFAPKAKIIHVDVDAAAISKNVVVDIPIVADARVALEQMVKWVEPKDTSEWMKKIRKWNEEHPLQMRRDLGMTPQMVMEGINKVFNKNAIYMADVGQHQMWAAQYLELDETRQFYTSGGMGTMGYAFPAALGAKIARPDKDVVCVVGDGGFQMNMQEMATAVTTGTPVTVCLMNNWNLGMVRQIQHMFYGKRFIATCLRKRDDCPSDCKGPGEQCPPYVPDFQKWADAYSVPHRRITKEEEILPALEWAKSNTDVPTVLEFMIDSYELVLPMVPGGKAMREMILNKN